MAAAVNPDEGVVARRARFEEKLKNMRGSFDPAPFMRDTPEWVDARGPRDYEAMYMLERAALPLLAGWREQQNDLDVEREVRPIVKRVGWSGLRLLFPAWRPKLTDVVLFRYLPNYDVEFTRGVIDTDPSILLEQYIHIDEEPDDYPSEPSVMINELLHLGNIKAVMLLLEYDETAKYLNTLDRGGETSLHLLAQSWRMFDEHRIMPIARRLIELGADPNIKNVYGTLASESLYIDPKLKAYLKSMEGLVRVNGEWRPNNNDLLSPGYRAAMRTLLGLAKIKRIV
jgi:hypothetical protein